MNPLNQRFFSSSLVRFRNGQNQQNNQDDKKDKKNDDEKVRALIMKMAFWTIMSYVAILFSLYFLSGSGAPDEEVLNLCSINLYIFKKSHKISNVKIGS